MRSYEKTSVHSIKQDNSGGHMRTHGITGGQKWAHHIIEGIMRTQEDIGEHLVTYNNTG